MSHKKTRPVVYCFIAIFAVLSSALLGTVAYFSSISVTERKIDDVQKIRVYDQYNITLFAGKLGQGIEQISFRLSDQKFFVDVPVNSAMWAEVKECDKNLYGCLDVHVHSLADIEYGETPKSRSSE
ncbi:MAG: hypothetical protein AAB575_03695 [Patescibacteria group bacterium]